MDRDGDVTQSCEFLVENGSRVGVVSGAWDGSLPQHVALSVTGERRSDPRKDDVPHLHVLAAGHDEARWWVKFEAFAAFDFHDIRAHLSISSSPAVAVGLVAAIASAIARSDSQLHDLISQPEWVLVSPSGETKLVLFPEHYIEGLCGPLVTATAPYRAMSEVAPEVLRGEAGIPASVYELGLALAELVSKMRPLYAANTVSALEGALRRSTPISAMVTVPPPLKSLIDVATSVAPSARPTIHEFAAELRKLETNGAVARALQSIAPRVRSHPIRFGDVSQIVG